MFYDDILNVNAYLRQKMRQNLEDTKMLAQDFTKLDQAYDTMLSQADDLLAQAQKLAENMGIDLSGLAEKPEKTGLPAVGDCAELLVTLPDDYDFSAAFRQLVEEAHAAGYTNVRPGDLLGKEEMQRAEAFNDALDKRFEKETGLTVRDMVILLTATAVRILCYYCFEYLFSRKAPDASETAAEAQKAADTTIAQDLAGITAQIGSLTGAKSIRSQHQILQEQVPFNVPDNKYFAHKDILGYHPYAGWLVGVVNILTNTVTTRKLESYSVHSGADTAILQVGQKLSTAMHVVFPVVQDFSAKKEALLAAVVREADILGVTNAPIQDVSANLQRTMAAEEENRFLLDQAQRVSSFFSSVDWTGLLKHTAVTAFLNQLITAIHAVNYDPERDGDMKLYTIRTHKILTISNAMAAVVNSLPAFTGDLTKLDGAGIITTCLSLFSSTRFWIEVKTNYLVSEYKKEVDRELAKADRYFRKG